MIKILYVCHGNICRSPLAEFVTKHKIQKLGVNAEVASGATSYEEEGNPVYYAITKYLDDLGIDYSKKRARRITKADGDYYDYIICMEAYNASRIKTIIEPENFHKIYRLLDFTDSPKDIADPWYTRDFDACFLQINAGVDAFLRFLQQNRQI